MKELYFAARPLIVDLLGTICFAILIALHVDLVIAVGAGIAISIGIIAMQLSRHQRVAALQWLSLALVILSGLAALWAHDPRFIMAKPSLVYIAVGVVMLQRGWMTRYIPPIAVAHIGDVTEKFGYAWSALMFATAAANIAVVIWSPANWPLFLALFPLISKVLLFAIQFIVSRSITIKRLSQIRSHGTIS
jgi:intracellular septation protein